MNPDYADKKKYIGIEIEFNYKRGTWHDSQERSIIQSLENAGVSQYCELTEDGSCGLELKVLVPENNFKAPLRKIFKVITGLKHRADRRCGLHVHLDMRNRDVKACYKRLFMTQKLLYKLLPSHRRYNEFCRANFYPEFDTELQERRHTRYLAINPHSYSKHKTLEVRLHQNTLSASTIINWISLLLNIVESYDIVDKPIETIEEVGQVLKLRHREFNSLKKRYNKYNKQIGA